MGMTHSVNPARERGSLDGPPGGSAGALSALLPRGGLGGEEDGASSGRASDGTAPSSHGQELWQHAKEKIMTFVDFSMGFHTLRDMTGNHTLDPRKLKLICRLGSALPSCSCPACLAGTPWVGG